MADTKKIGQAPLPGIAVRLKELRTSKSLSQKEYRIYTYAVSIKAPPDGVPRKEVTTMERAQTTIRLPTELKEQLQKEADRRGDSFNETVIRLLLRGLESQSSRADPHTE